MNIDLSGRVALVTGGTRGIGREIARVLVASGARVAITGRDRNRAAEVAATLGASVRGFACDMADTASIDTLVADVEKEFGSLDILVNNAGLTRDNLIMRLKDDDWDTVLDANLRGAFATVRAASRGMMKRRWGRIINISSVVGLIGNRGQSAYAASKAGLIGFTKSVAKELATRNILSNVIAPGFVETEMTEAMTPEARTAIISQIPVERLGKGADIAHLVAFLASEQAGYITGQVFVVDGGLVM